METIFIWLSGALIFGYVFKILSLPILIGFITSGLFFSYINFSDTDNILTIPSKIGVELLLFSIGLKVKPKSFLSLSFINIFFLHSIIVTAIYFFLTNINLVIETKILLCIILTFSSTVIASKSLEDRKEINSFHGRNSVLVLIFQDILALFLLLYTNENNVSYYSFLLLLIPFCVPFFKIILTKLKSNEELELLASIIIGLFIGGYLFDKLGLSGELGSLIMGMLLSNYKSASKLGEKIWSLREILLVAFFLSLGMKLELNNDIIINSLLLILLLLIKFLSLFFLLIFFKLRAYSSFLISISLLTYSEFALIVASSWYDNNLIDKTILGILVFSVCMSFIIGSVLNKYVHEIFVKFEKFLIKFERKKHHPDEQPHTFGEAEIMIVGMGRIGTSIFNNLILNGMKVVGVDADTELALLKLSEGNRVAFADAEDPGFWSKLRFGKLKVIVLALPEFHAQNWSTLQARRFGFSGKIIIPTRSKDGIKILKESGADEIYDAYEAAGIGVSNIIKEI